MSTAIIPAICSRQPMRPFATDFGQRTKAEFELADGQKIAVFADATDNLFMSICKGQKVDLIHGAKGYSVGRVGEAAPPHFLGQQSASSGQQVSYSPPAATPQQVAPAAGPTPEQVGSYIRKQVRTMAFCMGQVQAQHDLKHLSEDNQRAMAISLFIQTQQKFRL